MLAGLFKATVRIVAIIVLSVVLLSALGYAAYAAHEAYKSHQAAPYETMKTWTRPIQHPLDMSLMAKTKVVNGQLYQSYELKGWPAYMTDPAKTEKNRQAVITFLYYDKDGFVLYEKKVNVLEFSLWVGEDGKPQGLEYQSVDPFKVDTYSRFDRINLQWTLDTSPPAPVVATDEHGPWEAYKKPVADQCAPGLSKADRLKRLAQYGTVRETGLDTFSAGGHVVTFISGGEVLICR